jgi:hypothetical protein
MQSAEEAMKDFHFNTADALEKAKADRDKPVTPVEYKPVISNVGADANMLWPDTMYGLLPKGTGKITLHESKPRTWVGLTDEDLANCSEDEVRWALHWEKLLKEKNT